MSTAFATAERIAKAIEKKLVKYKAFVRQVDLPEFSYIEIAVRPPNGSVNDEVVTAYSSQFYESATDENIKDKALRVLKDFRIMLELPGE